MPGTPNTAERIALIAGGNLDSKIASQFLNETFDAPDYLQAISGYSPQQQFIDGLYEAYLQPFQLRGFNFDLAPHSFFVTAPSIRRLVNAASGPLGKREE
jgi:hypothetical protein